MSKEVPASSGSEFIVRPDGRLEATRLSLQQLKGFIEKYGQTNQWQR